MIITEKHYKQDIKNCNVCGDPSEFLLGRCSQCITSLHLKAYGSSQDTNDFFWKKDVNGWDGGKWELKKKHSDKKFVKKEHYPYGDKSKKPFVYYIGVKK